MIQVAARPLIGCLVFVVIAVFGIFVILISSDSFVQGSLYKDATSNVAFPFYDTALHTAALDHPSPGREKQWPTAVSINRPSVFCERVAHRIFASKPRAAWAS